MPPNHAHRLKDNTKGDFCKGHKKSHEANTILSPRDRREVTSRNSTHMIHMRHDSFICGMTPGAPKRDIVVRTRRHGMHLMAIKEWAPKIAGTLLQKSPLFVGLFCKRHPNQ